MTPPTDGGAALRAASPLLRLLALSLPLLGAAAACESLPEELRPPAELVDSLGISVNDAVWEIGLTTAGGTEVASPSVVTIDRPGWLSFRSDDPRARRVLVDTAGLSAAQRGWLGDRVQGSPPLVNHEARWILDLREAPPGELRFRVSGSGREAVVRVAVTPER